MVHVTGIPLAVVSAHHIAPAPAADPELKQAPGLLNCIHLRPVFQRWSRLVALLDVSSSWPGELQKSEFPGYIEQHLKIFILSFIGQCSARLPTQQGIDPGRDTFGHRSCFGWLYILLVNCADNRCQVMEYDGF